MIRSLLFIVAIGLLLSGFNPRPLCFLQTKQLPVEILKEATSSAAARVVRVIDGDTIEIEGGRRVRYIGINAPELHDPKRPAGCFGQEAADANKKLVEGKVVWMVKDVSETDKYGRLLRYVFVNDIFVNDWLVRNGFASLLTYPPDVRYRDQFGEAAREARQAGKGLWTSCKKSD